MMIKNLEMNSNDFINICNKYNVNITKNKMILIPKISDGKELMSNNQLHAGHPSIKISNENVVVYNPLTPEVKNYFIKEGFNVEIAMDASKTVAYETLYDSDIILPIIFFVVQSGYTVFLNVLSSYLTDKYLNKKQNLKLDIVLVETEKNNYKRFQFDGDSESIIEVLKELKIGDSNER